MDFIDVIRQFATRAEKIKNNVLTEEATKTSLIMPFFQQVWGYDVFNPDEFFPEFIADVGTKKGEKVDYAVCFDNNPIILVEAKWCGSVLDKHDAQLFRYYSTTTAKFGILTNGLIYKFYTDLEKQNLMDMTPFLEFDLLDLKDALIPEIKKFCKANFNISEIFNSASELKYSGEIRKYFDSQLKEPSNEFVKHILTYVYDGLKTQTAIDKFKPLIKNTLNTYINELMNEKITSALKKEKAVQPVEEPPPQQPEEEIPVVSTEEEMEAYAIVKSILREICDVNRLSYQHTTNYKVVLFDENSRKRICRFWLKGAQKYFTTPDENKKPVRHDITSVNDIYNYADFIKEVCSRYL